MKASLVYSNIHIYRFAMNLLYRGAYRQRFTNILKLVPPETRSLCELCFGDTIIAEWCRAQGVRWTGIDINEGLIQRARKLGFDAFHGDVLSIDLPNADVFVMAGSLYHFHADLPTLMHSILSRTNRFILSEPVRNLSSESGLMGWWARRSADPGTGPAAFRYDKRTLLAALQQQQKLNDFEMTLVLSDRDCLLEIRR